MRCDMIFGTVLIGMTACGPKGAEPSTAAPLAQEPRARDLDASDAARVPTDPAAATDPPAPPSVVRLGPGDATLVGRVLDRDGQAWAGVSVVVVPDCVEGAAVVTDASGGFSVGGLPDCPTVVVATIDGASDEILLQPRGKPMQATLRPRCSDDVILIDAPAATGSEPPPASARPKPPRRVPCPDRGRERSHGKR